MNVNELQQLKIQELAELAAELKIDSYSGMNKQELIVKILEVQSEKQEGVTATATGVLEVLNEGYGFLRSPDFNYLPGPDDIYVSPSQIKRFGLRTGHKVSGQIRPPKSKERFYALLKLEKVNGKDPEKLKRAILFDNLTPLYPDEKITLEIEEDPTKKAFEDNNIPISTLKDRVAHIKKVAFDGKRLVVFSGGDAKDDQALMDEVLAIHQGDGNGSIIGRNCFQRSRVDALALLERMIQIYKSK